MIEAILVILLGLQPYMGDKEAPDARKARLTVLATAIDRAVEEALADPPLLDEDDAPALAAMLVTIGFWESGFARHVHEGRCKFMECDGGRARSPWQFQRVPPVVLGASTIVIKDLWYAYRGADQASTDDAAWAATVLLLRARENCSSWQGAIAQYATGSGCRWANAEKRMVTFRRVLGKLED